MLASAFVLVGCAAGLAAGTAKSLTFATCPPRTSQQSRWRLVSIADIGAAGAPQKTTRNPRSGPLLIQSCGADAGCASLPKGGAECLVPTGGSGLALAPCDPDVATQIWLWNQSTPKESPPNSGGFVVSGGSGNCPDATGFGVDFRCCLTDNSPAAAAWGCCPNAAPSPCTNQRVELVGEGAGGAGPVGALKVARSGNCLTWSAPPPPPAAVVTFDKIGAIDFKSYESTPVVFNGRKLLMETITLTYPRHISHWDPVQPPFARGDASASVHRARALAALHGAPQHTCPSLSR